MLADLSIRAMCPEDLTFAAQCTAGEGWVSENAATLEGFYLYDPAGCLLAEWAGTPVGICFATSYGQSGFIGELIVRTEVRGRGIGGALLNCGVDYLRQRGAQTVYLDGIIKAVPLYERNGFRKVCRSWRFAGRLAGKQHPSVRPMQVADLPAVFALDRQVFGADRSFFLRRRFELFPKLARVMLQHGELVGYIEGRCGEGWVSAGPWIVSEKVSNLAGLLEALACEAGDSWLSLGILEVNLEAVELVHSLGFSERPDSPWRMALGPPSDLGAAAQCYAVGSAAKG